MALCTAGSWCTSSHIIIALQKMIRNRYRIFIAVSPSSMEGVQYIPCICLSADQENKCTSCLNYLTLSTKSTKHTNTHACTTTQSDQAKSLEGGWLTLEASHILYSENLGRFRSPSSHRHCWSYAEWNKLGHHTGSYL